MEVLSRVFVHRYLTLDQTRKAVPLAASDPLVYQVPLVGVWLKPGSDSVTVEEVLDHPAAWAACLRFLHCAAIAVSPPAPSVGARLAADTHPPPLPLVCDAPAGASHVGAGVAARGRVCRGP